MTMFVTLLRWHARRDWLQLSLWIVGAGVLALFSTVAVMDSYGNDAERADIMRLAVANRVILLFRGLPQGTDLNAFVFFEIFTYLALLAALMSTFLAVRHTRGEEESGRAELIVATRAGRITPTLATLAHGVIANLVLGAVVALGFIAGRTTATGALVTGLATAAVGISFLAVGMLGAQFFRSARAANSFGVFAVVLAFLLRGIGDALGTPSADGVSMVSASLSWVSPIGWAQHTDAFGSNTLLPLLLNLALALVGVLLVLLLQTWRDDGASLVPSLPGRPNATPLLSSSFGLAWRLAYPALISWCVGGIVAGLLAGSLYPLVQQVTATNDTLTATLQSLGGAGATVQQALLSTMFSIVGVFAAGFAIQTIAHARTEESHGTAEMILATRVSRLRWLTGYLATAAIGILVVSVVSAASSSLGVLSSGSDASLVSDSWKAGLAQLPVALIYLGLAAVALVLLPRLTAALSWSLLGITAFIGIFGGLIGLPDWAIKLSPFAHAPVPTGDSIDWSGGVWLTGIAVLLLVIAVLRMPQRELTA